MHLVFIHGWGFDPGFWDALSARLPQYKQSRFDFGFFGAPPSDVADLIKPDEPLILVGHSLGFLYGLQQPVPWAGWVAINGFARFIATPDKSGCVPAAVLRDMQRRLKADAAKTLAGFYQMIDAIGPNGIADDECLKSGLDFLRDSDITEKLARMRQPGLVLASRHDPLVPVAASEALGVPVVWSEAGGHCLPQSDPDWCAGQIAAFIDNQFATRQKIVRHFDRAAMDYDAAATMQKQVAAKLVADAHPTQNPAHILDLGCGTGFVAAAAARRWPDAAITGLDASPAMLKQARQRMPQLKTIEGNAACLNLPRRYDLIFSSMMLHWLPDLPQVIRHWAEGLAPGGSLHIALLGADSFQEWRQLCATAGVESGLWPMPDVDDVARIAAWNPLPLAGRDREEDTAVSPSHSFSQPGYQVRTESQIISYASAIDFMQTLKQTGAASPRPGHRKSGAGRMRALLRAAPQPFPVTYQVIYMTLSSGDAPVGSI